MNILILGSGVVGANLAKKLSEQGKNVFLLDDDANELKNLSERYDIKTIFDECVTYGIIPFSILARHAFISKEFLNSFLYFWHSGHSTYQNHFIHLTRRYFCVF